MGNKKAGLGPLAQPHHLVNRSTLPLKPCSSRWEFDPCPSVVEKNCSGLSAAADQPLLFFGLEDPQLVLGELHEAGLRFHFAPLGFEAVDSLGGGRMAA